jgi:hypothetical protein
MPSGDLETFGSSFSSPPLPGVSALTLASPGDYFSFNPHSSRASVQQILGDRSRLLCLLQRLILSRDLSLRILFVSPLNAPFGDAFLPKETFNFGCLWNPRPA